MDTHNVQRQPGMAGVAGALGEGVKQEPNDSTRTVPDRICRERCGRYTHDRHNPDGERFFLLPLQRGTRKGPNAPKVVVGLTAIDIEDDRGGDNVERFTANVWSMNEKGYAVRTENCRVSGKWKTLHVRLHRELLGLPQGVGLTAHGVCDHLNDDPLDNRACNLRQATNANNVRRGNHAVGKSGLIGVTFRPNRRKPWKVEIKIDGKPQHLGYFATAAEAGYAYDAAALALDPLARTNVGAGLLPPLHAARRGADHG